MSSAPQADGRTGRDVETPTAADEAAPAVDEHEPDRARLALERERYRELFHFAPVGYCITDARGVVHEANEWLGRMLGVDPRFLVGKPLATYVPSSERREFRRRLRRLSDGEPEQTWELRMQAPAHASSFAEVTVARARSPAHAGDLLWAVRDVTERREAEESIRRLARELEVRVSERTADLERERAQLETVMRQLPAGIAIAEAPSGRVVLANRLARAFVGPGGARPETAAMRADGRPFEPEELPLARALAGETVVGVRMHLPDGDSVVEASAGPVRTRGKTHAAVAIFVDVTQRERADRAVREFVTHAAHELQTPLAAIVSATDVLQSGAKEIREERDRFLAHVERQCLRLTRLVRALLVLARVQSRTEHARTEVIPLEALLQQIAADVAPSASVPLLVECESGAAAVANADLAWQAILNLAANAAYHTERGKIVIAARMRDDSRVVVEVRDTGRGVPRDQQERVFDRFYRGRDGAERGFGLGLPIVRQAASALGGEVELESEPGVGTTVRLTLPGARLVTP